MRGMGSVDRSESFSVGVLLAAAGGMLDAYTYLCRGGVFANAETGNMVLLGIAVLEGRLPDALRYFVPVLAYAAGVMISVFAERALRGRGRLWKQLTLAAEGAVLALALAFPGETFDFLVCVLVSFVCAAAPKGSRFTSARATPAILPPPWNITESSRRSYAARSPAPDCRCTSETSPLRLRSFLFLPRASPYPQAETAGNPPKTCDSTHR